jgi:ATP-dependent DNA ligase
VAVYDRAHISRFEWLRARPQDGRATLPVYMGFDVLELDGKDWRPEPLWKRGRVLEELVAQERQILPVTLEQRAQGLGAGPSQRL